MNSNIVSITEMNGFNEATNKNINFFFLKSGVSVTLKHPYERDIPEPIQYEQVTRHAELGKRTSFECDMLGSKASPDLHVSRTLNSNDVT